MRTWLYIALSLPVFLAGAQAGAQEARAWVEDSTVTVGRPFWIYIEASGENIRMPTLIDVDHLKIDPQNISQSSSLSLGPGGTQRREKRGFWARALVAGKIEIPAFTVEINGKTVKTEPFEITAVDREPQNQNRQQSQRRSQPAGQSPPRTDMRKDDLVFIDAVVNRRDVYQGQPVLLRLQLWRLRHRDVESGQRRGGDTRYPTTEGFYVEELESQSYERERNGWPYYVIEERRLLYPTQTGKLTITPWRWDGLARVRNPRSFFYRDEYNYNLETDPIVVNVKPLPERPPNFSGAVGDFAVKASLSNESILQGVPLKLSVNVAGTGNPDAIGDPAIPDLEWAYVSEPKRSTQKSVAPETQTVTVSKDFVYTITPLEAGQWEVGPIEFAFFDPAAESYRSDSAGPFTVEVLESAESQERLVVSQELELEKESVDILGEDIRPIVSRPGSIGVHRPSGFAWPAVAIGPVLAYGLFAVVAARRERFRADPAFARAYHAPGKAHKALDAVEHSAEPADLLFRTLVEFIGDVYNRDAQGMTSADIDAVLAERGVDTDTKNRVTKILRACERARYASQELRATEMRALIDGARTSIDALAEPAKRGTR